MKKLFVRDLESGKRIRGTFFVKNKTVAIDKQGKPYLIVLLSDKTGDVEARLWENVEHFSRKFDLHDIVVVDGWTQLYQGKLQIKLVKIYKNEEEEENIEDYFPAGKKDKEDVRREIVNILKAHIKDKFLWQLIRSFIEDASFMEKFLSMPAAKSLHHAYLGGLAEHTLSVMKVVVKLSEHYRGIYGSRFNPEVAIAGAFLHDVGKVAELSSEKNFSYTDEGRLIGHIVLGMGIVDEKIKRIDSFPVLLRLHLLHIIVSHHGSFEFGSPKRPKTLEALLVHFADNLDSKMESFFTSMDGEKSTDGWTQYIRQHDRYLFTETYSSEIPDDDEERFQLNIFPRLDE